MGFVAFLLCPLSPDDAKYSGDNADRIANRSPVLLLPLQRSRISADLWSGRLPAEFSNFELNIAPRERERERET